ncbi:MAG TPA: hypothetical protein PL182_03125, partial [Pseudobdellovibrionaceae bacterium]|nr:hypothetical protein [Pseudobdellovibrionaceae bacterium]
MRNSDPSPLMDRRTLIAIVVIGVFMMAWQHFMNQKYPPAVSATATPAETQPVRPGTEEKVDAPVSTAPAAQGEIKKAEPVEMRPEELLTYEDDKVRFTLSSKGMGFKEYLAKDYKNAEGNPVRLGFSPLAGLFELRLNGSGRVLDFRIEEEGPGV